MPSIYLSPSTQEYNEYYDKSGTEEYYMNLVADYMEPILISYGIDVTRNSPGMTASQSAIQSAGGSYDLHLALHSNAAGVGNAGNVRGVDVYYYKTSARGKRAADIIAENFKKIYPLPNLVKTVPNTSFVELKRTKAPAVLIEMGYHDNAGDAEWIKNNLEVIAKNLSDSVAEFLGITVPEEKTVKGKVITGGGRLNVRNEPSFEGKIIGKLENGRTVNVISDTGEWFEISTGDYCGYVFGKYLEVESIG